MPFRVATAPVSWGVMDTLPPPFNCSYSHVLDQMAQAGYGGTELGPHGFFPTDSAALRPELDRRGLRLCSAFVMMP